MTAIEFTLSTTLAMPIDDAEVQVRTALADVGFGVLTEIDIAATLQAKLGVEVAPQRILGACRPQLAHRALQSDPRIAALLPCNVVLAATPDGGTRVDAFDPAFLAAIVDDAELATVAADARERLQGMMERLVAGAGPEQRPDEAGASDATRA
ncbi:DUF302 domain-containing protein [Nocardioides sp. R-C-SC26]|uniref:DUF302 domain-containing protein n=1 Tax=Nocardioides sp. R-C-SC26 TaxID=2870414 RepID=UPI001E630DFF|nr:DUF302 domain-containing protein [Nocardioides sp. R-C-SC26]